MKCHHTPHVFTFTAPSAASSIVSLYKTSSTSLSISWLHDIPKDMLNGVLIGYRVRWQGSRSDEVLLDNVTNSYTITDLTNSGLYKIYVAGRTNGGIGVERNKTFVADEDDDENGKQVDEHSLTSCLMF